MERDGGFPFLNSSIDDNKERDTNNENDDDHDDSEV